MVVVVQLEKERNLYQFCSQIHTLLMKSWYVIAGTLLVLPTHSTNYFVYLLICINFSLRKLFYSKQCFKNSYYSSAQTSHKWTCSIRLILERYRTCSQKVLYLKCISGLWYIQIARLPLSSQFTSYAQGLATFLTLGVLPMVEDEKRIREKGLGVKQFWNMVSSSSIMT